MVGYAYVPYRVESSIMRGILQCIKVHSHRKFTRDVLAACAVGAFAARFHIGVMHTEARCWGAH